MKSSFDSECDFPMHKMSFSASFAGRKILNRLVHEFTLVIYQYYELWTGTMGYENLRGKKKSQQ